MRHAILFAFLILIPKIAWSGDRQPCLPAGYMPEWSATRFAEAEMCGDKDALPPGRTYAAAVVAAKRHDRKSLEQVIACSYRADAAAGELHSGVMQQLLLAWGDIEFSHALAAVIARRRGKSPVNAFMLYERDLRFFFPLTARVYYGR
jgi:hypothetical protein